MITTTSRQCPVALRTEPAASQPAAIGIRREAPFPRGVGIRHSESGSAGSSRVWGALSGGVGGFLAGAFFGGLYELRNVGIHIATVKAYVESQSFIEAAIIGAVICGIIGGAIS